MKNTLPRWSLKKYAEVTIAMSFLEFRYSVPTDWPYWLSPKSALDTYLKLIAYQGVLESLLIWTSGPCFM